MQEAQTQSAADASGLLPLSRSAHETGMQTTSSQNVSLQPNVSSQHSSLAAMMAGQNFHANVVAANPNEYVSLFELLTTNKDNTSCKLQATLLYCDSEPRNINDLLRKRKSSDVSNLVVDCILLDLTAPIKLTCWGNLAAELCDI